MKLLKANKRDKKLKKKFKLVNNRDRHDLHQNGSLSRSMKKALRNG